MKEHPVPQQISAFQFKLFGNLTLRQFLFVGTGFLLGWFLIYTIKQPFISFPLAFIIFTVGLSIAVVPMQGRSLDKWFFSFLNIMLSPTLRVYKKDEEIPEFLKPHPVEKLQNPTLTSFTQTQKKLQLEEYLERYSQGKKNSLDWAEEKRLASLNLGLRGPFPTPTQSFPGQLQNLPLLGFGKKEIIKDGNFKLASSLNFSQSPQIAVRNKDHVTYFSEIGRPRVRKLGAQTSDNSPLQPAGRIISLDYSKNNVDPLDIFEYTPSPNMYPISPPVPPTISPDVNQPSQNSLPTQNAPTPSVPQSPTPSFKPDQVPTPSFKPD